MATPSGPLAQLGAVFVLLTTPPSLLQDCGSGPDEDQDGVVDTADNCPSVYQPQQTDEDGDGVGDACELCHGDSDHVDADGDGLVDCFDSCPAEVNRDNQDSDGDTVGDVCDNCVDVPNVSQSDMDGDGTGDRCEPPSATFQLEETDLARIHAALRAGDLTCEALVRRYLDRIHRYDLDVSDGPPLNSVLALDEEILVQARHLDARFASEGDLVGPLHCAPVILKDNYDAVGTMTTQGTLALLDTYTPDDAFSVAGLRAAGALILGKASMDELAWDIEGLSGRSGRTGNAYRADYNPGGSSSGTGVAVSANFVLMGTGTDNCASIRLPAAYNGLNSLRPSTGLISLDGIFPGVDSLTGVGGPITRSIEDMAVMLDGMVGADPRDPKTLDPDLIRPQTYTAFLNPRGLEGKRIGVVRTTGAFSTFLGASADTQVVFNRSFETLRALGATVVDTVLLPDFQNINTGPGFIEGVDAYLSGFDASRSSWQDMCESGLMSNYDSVEACLKYGEANQGLDSQAYSDALAKQEVNRAYVEGMMDDLQLDVLIYPVDAFGAAQEDAAGANCALSAYSGMPALVMRGGFSQDQPPLPIGIEILGRKFDEPTLLEIAYAWELHTGWRRPPTLTSAVADDPDLPSLDIAAFNRLHTRIGQAGYDQVISEEGLQGLTAEVFTEIVTEQIEASDMGYLLGP